MDKQVNHKPIKDLARVTLSDGTKGPLTYEPFEANGHRYCFIRPGDPIGPKKWGYYTKLKVVAGTGQTFESIIEGFGQIMKLAGEDKRFADIRTEIILLADSYRKALLDMSKARFDKAFYLCSLLIYREGVVQYEWDMNTAERDINDWLEDRINEQDLFFFAMLLTPGFNRIFQELSEEAARQAERLSAITG